MATYDAGIVTAYGAAVRGGYTGTYEEFCRQQAGYAQSAAAVAQAKEDVQELVEGIPADYTQLSEDVNTLKEELSELSVLNSFSVTWGQGNIIESNGASGGSAGSLYSKRLRTVLTELPDIGLAVDLPDNIQMQLFWYSENSTSSYIGCDALGDISNLDNPRGAYVRFVLAYTNGDTAITPSDADVSNVQFYTHALTDTSLILSDKAADAKATGDAVEAVRVDVAANTQQIAALEEDTTALKEGLSVLNSFSVTWDQGNIIESNGASGGSAGSLYGKRLRTVLAEVPDGGFAVDLPDNIQMQLYWYNTNTTSSYVGCDTLGDISNLDSPRGAYVRFVLAYSDPTLAITPRDADVANVHLYTHALTDTSLTLSGKAADAKAAGDAIRAAVPTVITVDVNGGADYTSLTKAIYENVNSGETIMVKPGTYDIVQEYVDLFGQSTVDSLADSNDLGGFQYGIRILNRKVIFQPGSHVVCDWTGHTVNGTHRFSAFSVAYNAEIEGLDLDCTATFYAIHDDYGTYKVYYKNIYRNCRLIGHNLVNQNVIGGGCKPYSRTIIDNCYVDNNATGTCVRYHNTNLSQEAEPVLWVSNSYFAQAISFRWYGTQTTKMTAYVNNCHASSITKGAEGSSTNDNVDLIMWNNETA